MAKQSPPRPKISFNKQQYRIKEGNDVQQCNKIEEVNAIQGGGRERDLANDGAQ